MPLPQEGRKYTYADYLTWPEGERWEILDGVPSKQRGRVDANLLDFRRRFVFPVSPRFLWECHNICSMV